MWIFALFVCVVLESMNRGDTGTSLVHIPRFISSFSADYSVYGHTVLVTYAAG